MHLQVLSDLLPGLAANRDRWPLWTYGRDRPEEPIFLLEVDETRTWYACPSWPERLEWSALDRFEKLERLVSETFRGWGCKAPAWEPGDETIYVSSPKEGLTIPEDLLRHRDSGLVEILVPDLLHLESLAVIAQYAFTIPVSADDVQPVDMSMGLLDLWDRDELAHRLMDSILTPYGEWTPEMDPRAFATVLQRGIQGPWSGISTRKLRAELGAHVLQAAGLLPARRGGSKQSVGRRRLLGLYEEAVDIASTIRGYEIPDRLWSAVLEMADADPRIAVIDIERARRNHPGSRLLRLATRLRHPFLRVTEVELLTDPRSRLSDAAAARKLVMDRLPRYDSRKDDRAFQTFLSEIR